MLIVNAANLIFVKPPLTWLSVGTAVVIVADFVWLIVVARRAARSRKEPAV